MSDVTKSTLPRKSWDELATDLLERFPGINRGELLKNLISHYFLEMKYGNKQEERAACDFLNLTQQLAIKLGINKQPKL